MPRVRDISLAVTWPGTQSTPFAYVLVGPTASGKTEIAHIIAWASQAAILSVDSMLVYRGMDIGTAKPSADEMRNIPYFGIDVVSPSESFNVAKFLQCAREAWQFCLAEKRPLLVVGGSGLYVKCLTEGFAQAPDACPDSRKRAEAILTAEGVDGLYRVLEMQDPDRARRLKDPRNPRRLIRALELAWQGAPTPSGWERASSPTIVGLRHPPTVLRERIIARVHAMYRSGLLLETERLLRNSAWSNTARQAIGYAEAAAVVRGEMSIEQAIAITIRRTRQLAKRQMTWFRHQANIHWVDVEPGDAQEEIARRVVLAWNEYGYTDLHI